MISRRQYGVGSKLGTYLSRYDIYVGYCPLPLHDDLYCFPTGSFGFQKWRTKNATFKHHSWKLVERNTSTTMQVHVVHSIAHRSPLLSLPHHSQPVDTCLTHNNDIFCINKLND